MRRNTCEALVDNNKIDTNDTCNNKEHTIITSNGQNNLINAVAVTDKRKISKSYLQVCKEIVLAKNREYNVRLKDKNDIIEIDVVNEISSVRGT